MIQPLFTVTSEHLESGLRGVPVGYCTTSYIDPKEGLFYRGVPITSVAYLEPEEVIYLLKEGKEGIKEEVESFKRELKECSNCSRGVLRAVESLPTGGDPMKLLATAVLILGMMESTNDYKRDQLYLMSKMPHLVATVINTHAGWGKTPPPDSRLGMMENFAHMLQIPGEVKEEFKKVLNLFHVLHYDHGGGNLSTFVAKAVASSREDLYGSVASAICALSGPLHGKANQKVTEFLQEIVNSFGENVSREDLEGIILERLKERKRIMGFGHAVLQVEDPRAAILYTYAKKVCPDYPLVKVALALRDVVPPLLSRKSSMRNPFPNVDAISGALLSGVGFSYPEYYPLLFALSRSVGIGVQVVYERCFAKGGKGIPIMRPRYFYK